MNTLRTKSLRRLLLLAAGTALPTAALPTAALTATVGDTLVVEGVQKVKIETRDTVQRIVISGAKDDPYFHYIQRISIPDTSAVRRTVTSVKNFNKIEVRPEAGHKQRPLGLSFHLSLGLSTMTGAPGGYSFKLGGAAASLSVLADWHPYGKKNVWSAGLGFEWRSYRSDKTKHWEKSPLGTMTAVDYPDHQQGKQTSLSVNSLQLPLLYSHYTDQRQRWGFSVGAVLNLNISAHAQWKYTSDENDYTATIDCPHIRQRPFTADLMGILHTPGLLSVYCKYTPMTFFRDGRGPEMHQLSIGLYL